MNSPYVSAGSRARLLASIFSAGSAFAAALLGGLALIPQAAPAQATLTQSKTPVAPRKQTAPSPAKPPAGKSGRTVLDGVYTASQADRGETAYKRTCAECHDLSFDGTPVDGSGFVDNWREFPLETLYNFIATTMPEDNPGELSPDSYRDVLSYILRRNGYPEGKAELTPEIIQTTLMVGPDGPKPLVSEMMVQVVGCFVPGPDNTAANNWILDQTSDPVRIRKVAPSAPAEIQRAATAAAGNQKFKLVNLEYFETGAGGQGTFSPDAYKGQRVLAKGALVKDSYGARINVMAIEKLGSACGR